MSNTAEFEQGSKPVAWMNPSNPNEVISYKKKNDIQRCYNLGIGKSAERYSTPLFTQSSPKLPVGWKLVPIEPDENMLNAGTRAFCAGGMLFQSMVEAAPQPEDDGWVKCSERLPTEADADVDENVWVYDKAMSNEKYRQTRAIWWTVKEVSDYTHWKPTGLKRPQPPKEDK